jgi:hypothetical protein
MEYNKEENQGIERPVFVEEGSMRAGFTQRSTINDRLMLSADSQAKKRGLATGISLDEFEPKVE